MDKLAVFSSMPVPRAVFNNALPAIAAMLMVLIYNVADTFFIGQTGNALMVAAVSLVTPVFLFFMAVGTIFGIGGTSVISRALGEGRLAYARQVSSFCLCSCIWVGLVMSAGMWFYIDRVLLLVGASVATWEMARTYLEIVLLSGPFVLIGNCYSNIIRAEGQSLKAMGGMLLGNLLNVILDPIMILGMGWNITGAAVATVIGNVAGALYYLFYLNSGQSLLGLADPDPKLGKGMVSSVLAIGVPASLGSVLMSVSSIIMNSHMAVHGDMAVAGIGVAIKVTMMTGMICLGLGQGVQPLLGYCYGAKNWPRYKEVLRFSLAAALLLSVALTAVCYLFVHQIVQAFVTDTSALSYGVAFAKILLVTSPLFGVFYILTSALQAMGAATPSLIINLSRQGLIYIPALYVLETIYGINGIVWAQPLADVLSFILVLILYLPLHRQMFVANGNENFTTSP